MPQTGASALSGNPPFATEAGESASQRLLARIVAILDDNKAEDITTIDLTGKSPMTDFMVVASGRSQRQVQALANHLARAIKEMDHAPKIEGEAQGDWVLIDAGDVVVHLFRPEVREFYKVEAIWGLPTPSAPAEPRLY